jgi:hypothetical protein
VVKAMASARDGYKEVILFSSEIGKTNSELEKKYEKFISRMSHQLIAVVEKTNVFTPTIVEVVLKAPLAKNSTPAPYRLQNYETTSMRLDN